MKKVTLIIMLGLSYITMGCSAPLKNSSGQNIPVRLITYEYDKNNPKPTVIIGHGSAGVKEGEHVLAEEINKLGYNSIIVDHYTLRGISEHTGTRVLGGLPDDRADDFIETAKWIQTQSWHRGKIAVVGISQGGAGVFALAARENNGLISAGIAFYPACGIYNMPSKPSMPVQVHIAEKDDLALPYLCYELKNEAYNVHYYSNATHSFDRIIPYNSNIKYTYRYDSKSKEESRINLKNFLSSHLK
jgi:dienelactone hydrolase